MTWRDAIVKTLDEIITQRGLDVTKVSKAAGYNPNYISKLKSGEKRRVTLDDLEPILQVIGIDLFEFLQAAQQRKDALYGELTIEEARHLRDLLQTENNIESKYQKLKGKLFEIFPELKED